jgi:hypothetical protein
MHELIRFGNGGAILALDDSRRERRIADVVAAHRL